MLFLVMCTIYFLFFAGTESGSGGRAFSTFGYSGATLVRPSPPAPPVLASEITLELLKDCPSQESSTYIFSFHIEMENCEYDPTVNLYKKLFSRFVDKHPETDGSIK